MFETRSEAGVLRLTRPKTVWLSTGWRGGRRTANTAYSITVDADWHPDDVAVDVGQRIADAGFQLNADTPILITGVATENARGARLGPVEAYATVGLSNPAALPMNPSGGSLPDCTFVPGTVNLVVGTSVNLVDGALSNLVAVVAEAKAATLLDIVGVPGTTSDAIVIASDPTGNQVEYSGSATRVGAAARACVREAVRAGFAARYNDENPPTSVDAAEFGLVTDAQATVFKP